MLASAPATASTAPRSVAASLPRRQGKGRRLSEVSSDIALLAVDDGFAEARAPGPGVLPVRVMRLQPGPWAPPRPSQPRCNPGLLVLDGLLVCDLASGLGRGAIELAGPEDLVRPWNDDGLLAAQARDGWRVLLPTRLAILDERVARHAAYCPQLTGVLLELAFRRSRAQALDSAIRSIRRMPDRLVVLLWRLAERWGRVTPEGVRLDLPLTHADLAILAGARRPSVTTALSELARADVVRREPGRGWLLKPSAEARAADLGAQALGAAR